jgi:putative effector of murein hydrolase
MPVLASLLAGALTACVSAMAIARALGAAPQTVMSIGPKSATTPIAMGISDHVGGSPSLTAVLVMGTGILGAMIARPVLNLLRVRDWRARGFAVGLAAHGLGTARAFQVDQLAGTFAGVAVGLNGLATALIVPLIARFFR